MNPDRTPDRAPDETSGDGAAGPSAGTPFRRPADRYGAVGSGMPRLLPWALVGLGVLAVVPLTIAVYQGFAPAVTANLVGWTVEDDFEVAVRVQVDKPADADASCEVLAYSANGEVVGRTRAELTGDRTGGIVSTTFPTSARTAAVDTGECTSEERR